MREVEQEAIDPEKSKALKAYLINQVKMTIVKAQNRVDEHAAYGALVLKGVEQLSVLLGVDEVSGSGVISSLLEIVIQVDIRSLLVMVKLGGDGSAQCDSMD